MFDQYVTFSQKKRNVVDSYNRRESECNYRLDINQKKDDVRARSQLLSDRGTVVPLEQALLTIKGSTTKVENIGAFVRFWMRLMGALKCCIIILLVEWLDIFNANFS